MSRPVLAVAFGLVAALAAFAADLGVGRTPSDWRFNASQDGRMFRLQGVMIPEQVTHSFQTSAGPTGSHWAQLNVSGGVVATAPVQQQLYDPADGIYRWMSSIAADRQGNVALGYSTSNDTNFPSIAYSGRLAHDPPNMLPRTEIQLIAGAVACRDSMCAATVSASIAHGSAGASITTSSGSVWPARVTTIRLVRLLPRNVHGAPAELHLEKLDRRNVREREAPGRGVEQCATCGRLLRRKSVARAIRICPAPRTAQPRSIPRKVGRAWQSVTDARHALAFFRRRMQNMSRGRVCRPVGRHQAGTLDSKGGDIDGD